MSEDSRRGCPPDRRRTPGTVYPSVFDDEDDEDDVDDRSAFTRYPARLRDPKVVFQRMEPRDSESRLKTQRHPWQRMGLRKENVHYMHGGTRGRPEDVMCDSGYHDNWSTRNGDGDSSGTRSKSSIDFRRLRLDPHEYESRSSLSPRARYDNDGNLIKVMSVISQANSHRTKVEIRSHGRDSIRRQQSKWSGSEKFYRIGRPKDDVFSGSCQGPTRLPRHWVSQTIGDRGKVTEASGYRQNLGLMEGEIDDSASASLARDRCLSRPYLMTDYDFPVYQDNMDVW